jgi:HPt (histidine-containing phosphotransfer) domain-containing protein
MADDTPVLAPSRFKELVHDFGDDADRVIAEFVAETDTGVAELRGLLAASPADPGRIKEAAHKLKGGCMLVGAARLQRVATTVEALARDGHGEQAVAHAPALDAAWSATRAALAQPR